jgi:hypothetical protein
MAAPPVGAEHRGVLLHEIPAPDSTGDHLTLSRTSLVTALVLASLFPAWAVLRGLDLAFYFEPTDTALYAARVGHALMGPAAIGTLVLLAIAAGVRWTAPDPSRVLTAGVAVALTTVLGGVGLAWVVADRAMRPYGPELRAIAGYVPPPGATYRFDAREASDHPEVTRYWQAPGTVRDVCRTAADHLAGWVDAGTTVTSSATDTGCSYRAERGGDHVVLYVQSYGMPPGTVSVTVKVRRA